MALRGVLVGVGIIGTVYTIIGGIRAVMITDVIQFCVLIGGAVLTVNSYHHQAVRASDLAGAYVAAGWSTSPAGDLVEAFRRRFPGSHTSGSRRTRSMRSHWWPRGRSYRAVCR